jgi:hypothetical protein
MAGKIEARNNGQKEMPFGSIPISYDLELLASIKQTIGSLKNP